MSPVARVPEGHIHLLPCRHAGHRVSHIFHFADIHIRNGDIDRARYDEYNEVFRNTLTYLDTHDSIQNESALIVIAGDLFHHKGKMDTPALKLFFWWMDELLNRAPVVMICGNHDFRQEDPRHPDMMETMSAPYNELRASKFPLMYLKNTGHYQYADIGFGVVSVRDTLKSFNTSGQIASLPQFPGPDTFDGTDVSTRIALFHGTICQSALPNEHRMSEMNGYPLDWFKGYDMLLLGDNHKQQVHQSFPMPWGYPGSLIQQDFGETTFGHGCLVWDIASKRATPVHIYNPKGMLTTKWSDKLNDFVVTFGRKDVCTIAEASSRTDFPRNPKVRIIGVTGDDVKLKESLGVHGIKPSYIIISSSLDAVADAELSDNATDVRDKIIHLADLNEPVQWVEYLKGVAPELQVTQWFTQPESLRVTLDEHTRNFLPSDVKQKLSDRNTRIQKAIDEYRDQALAKQGGSRITLKHMTWDYAMCYGQGNHFDFTEIQNNIALLNGRNASGKSSFLDVLCIGLYGEPTKHRNMLSGKKMTAKMIHDHRPAHKALMKVAIIFTLDDNDYEIVRSFTTQKKDDQTVYAQLQGAHIFKIDYDSSSNPQKELIADGSVMVEQWVSSYFGSIDDMLMSTIVCQLDMSNFFYLKQDEQKQILDHAMQLGSITAFAKVIKEAILAYNEWLTLVRTSLQVIETNTGGEIVTQHDLTRVQTLIAETEKQWQLKQQECTKLLSQVGNVEELPSLTPKELDAEEKRLQTKLEQFADIDETQMEIAYTAKGEKLTRFIQCEEEIKKLQDYFKNIQLDLPSLQDAMTLMDDIDDELKKHSIKERKPNVSRDHIHRIEKELKQWRRKYPDEWVEDPDQVHVLKEELNANLNQRREYAQKLASKLITKPEGAEETGSLPDGFKLSESRRHYNDLCERLKDLLARKVVPLRNIEQYDKWRADWNKWNNETKDVASNEDTVADYEERCEQYESYLEGYKKRHGEWEQLTKEMNQLQSELNELVDIPFNADCWACQLQPATKRRVQLTENSIKVKKTLSKITKYMKQYEQHGDIGAMENELKQTRKLYNARVYYEQTRTYMNAEHDAWEKAKQQHNENKLIDEQIAELNEQIVRLEKYIRIASWAQWKSWKNKMDSISNEIDDDQKELQMMCTFLAEFDVREKDMLIVQEERDKWDAHAKWTDTYNVLQQKHATYAKVIEYWELHNQYCILHQEMGDHGKNIQRIQQKLELNSRSNLLSRVRIYHSYKVLDEQRTSAQKMYQDACVQFALMETAMKNQEDKRDQITWYKQMIDEWTNTKHELQLLESKFVGDKSSNDGYKEWIYREKVAPLLENEVNKFLSTVELIRLKIQYEKKSFVYFLEDRGNLPTLDKASGYQNFVVGLAMRLALARIGAIGQNIRHLFIDEGFTACDVANIEKVPQLLRGIMSYGGYESILLMSHLEQVQDASEKQINIERKGVFSFIHYGKPYPVISQIKKQENDVVAVTKKRGRPKKSEQ